MLGGCNLIKFYIEESEKRIYVSVSDYIYTRDLKEFINNYKRTMKTIRPAQYRLIIEPRYFECENENDIKQVFVTFIKTGFKKIYLVDPYGEFNKNIKLGSMERKIFFNSVKIIRNVNEIL